jgi:hypothetical protein
MVLDHSMLVINEREYKSLYDWCQLVSHHEMRSKEKETSAILTIW